MGFLEKKLNEQETIIYKTKIHWIVLIKPVFTLVLFVFVHILLTAINVYQYIPHQIYPYMKYVALIVVFFFVICPFLSRLIKKLTTEIAVTNQRFLYKQGIISVAIQGMPLNKVENIDSRQTILGRILQYGFLTVKGSGSTPIRLSYISKPMNLRKELTTLIAR